ncbi:N-formylglutamate amidohydrolase [Novosphingobium sp. M1R2S20]|uniref:N-formylglutamate amidohydrolase n=1 Tax=Novosphingobium rhizovicinum TaxID=3228928 RepID=A0ABV3REM1_9SPHN
MAEGLNESDSREIRGGAIPGTHGVSAFRAWGGEHSVLPVLVAVPHAGRAYPAALLRDMRHAEAASLKLEDRYVDKLAAAVARETKVALLVAQAPRAMIDLNRAPDDVDWEMISQPKPAEAASTATSRRARSGLGLIPRRLPGIGELWRRRHDEAELTGRVGGIHEPYHAQLAAMLTSIRERWGAALLIDLHSMPPLPSVAGQPPAQFVIGDRFGASSHGSLVGGAFAYLAERGVRAAHNRPYAGGYVLERHASPAQGVHAIQIEVDRTSYLDSRLAEPGPGFDTTVDVLIGLVRCLAAVVAELALTTPQRREAGETGWSLAAE